MPDKPTPPATGGTPDANTPPAGQQPAAQQPAAQQPPAAQPPEGQQPAAQNPEDALGDAGKRALQAERDARKAAEQAAREAQARVREFEERDLSEQEKAQRAADEARREAAEATARALRLEVAIEKSLPAELVDRLRGSTKDELAADADALLALVRPADGGQGGATPPPAGSFDGGARPPAPTPSLDERIAEAERAQDWTTVDRLNALKLAQMASGAR